MLALPALLLTLLAATQGPQDRQVRHIDFYGLRSTSVEAASEALGIRVGDSLEMDRPAAKQRLLALDAIEDAVLIQMFMPGNEILLVGIQEKGAPVPTFHQAPEGDAQLPDGMVAAYTKALELEYEAMLRGEGGEERVDGHSFSKVGPAAEQERIVARLARAHPEEVRAALKDARDPQQRAVAAKAISYFPGKRGIVADLAYAIRDADASVRNNAIRALSVLADWANGQEDLRVEFDYTPLFVLLESLEWTDRNKAAALLCSLTLDRDEALLRQLREGSLPALAEMAKWHSVGHAAFSIRILGRLAGLTEEQITAGEKRARSGDFEAHGKWVQELERLASAKREAEAKPAR
ncbi:MAG: hypothetical protein P1V81_05830 [Planctomycetota bacterium]|nr:hypothetical protein [Planctomycetota bacterium]